MEKSSNIEYHFGAIMTSIIEVLMSKGKYNLPKLELTPSSIKRIDSTDPVINELSNVLSSMDWTDEEVLNIASGCCYEPCKIYNQGKVVCVGLKVFNSDTNKLDVVWVLTPEGKAESGDYTQAYNTMKNLVTEEQQYVGEYNAVVVNVTGPYNWDTIRTLCVNKPADVTFSVLGSDVVYQVGIDSFTLMNRTSLMAPAALIKRVEHHLGSGQFDNNKNNWFIYKKKRTPDVIV
ncbi:hypothetical protein [Proteus phage 10]|nr:hypothetical protein [Proteus phage 10]